MSGIRVPAGARKRKSTLAVLFLFALLRTQVAFICLANEGIRNIESLVRLWRTKTAHSWYANEKAKSYATQNSRRKRAPLRCSFFLRFCELKSRSFAQQMKGFVTLSRSSDCGGQRQHTLGMPTKKQKAMRLKIPAGKEHHKGALSFWRSCELKSRSFAWQMKGLLIHIFEPICPDYCTLTNL